MDTDTDTDTPYDVVPADRVRRTVARRMRAAVADMPHVTLHARADARELLATRGTAGCRAGP